MPNEFSIVYLRQKIYLTHLNGLNSVGVKRGLRCGLFLAERRDLGLIGLYIVWPSSPLWNIIITLLLHLFSPSSCYVLMNAAAAATTADFWTTMLEHPRFSPSSCWVTHERRRQRRRGALRKCMCRMPKFEAAFVRVRALSNALLQRTMSAEHLPPPFSH